MKTSRKEIEEIFRVNQLGCDGHVMPTVKEWNNVGTHINELTAQVEELRNMLKQTYGPARAAYKQGMDCGPSWTEFNELLTRIGKDNA